MLLSDKLNSVDYQWFLVRTKPGHEPELCAHIGCEKDRIRNILEVYCPTHTRGYVAVALHPEREVGIDIEQVSERALKVADRFMCGEELAGQAEALKGCPEEAEQAALYYVLLHWSAKETLYKLMGEEEVDFSRHLRILPFRLRPEGRFSGCECRTRQGMRYEIRYMLHPDFVCTWSMGG